MINVGCVQTGARHLSRDDYRRSQASDAVSFETPLSMIWWRLKSIRAIILRKAPTGDLATYMSAST